MTKEELKDEAYNLIEEWDEIKYGEDWSIDDIANIMVEFLEKIGVQDDNIYTADRSASLGWCCFYFFECGCRSYRFLSCVLA